jgi:hypothetical protein
MWTTSSVTTPAGTRSGQRTMNGTRSEPSIVRMVRADPWARGAAPRPTEFRTVITAEEDNGVFAQVQCVDLVEDLPDAVIHFGHRIGEFAPAGITNEVPVGNRRVVELC